jgi:uncharacterized protein (DUF486 family)
MHEPGNRIGRAAIAVGQQKMMYHDESRRYTPQDLYVVKPHKIRTYISSATALSQFEE